MPAGSSVFPAIIRLARSLCAPTSDRCITCSAAARRCAIRVGVGRTGLQWSGTTFINNKMLRPHWVPPAIVRRDKPNLPSLVPAGAPNNPVGAAVLFLAGGERAIHGTNNPGSIGGAVSYGCIRMLNADVLDLYDRVSFGTKVIVTR
jgi:lipoprotein-anchoring transpeptidase ErfK/SrfK